MKTLICEECGKEFSFKRVKKYCSEECSKSAQKKKRISKNKEQFGERNCEYCGERFVPYRESGRFCKEECTLAYGRYITQGWKPAEDKKCLICGKMFKTESKYRLTYQEYCSPECAEVSRHVGKTCEIYYVKCKACGKEFISNRKRKYCQEKECQDKRWLVYYKNSKKHLKKNKSGLCKECGKPYVNEYGEKRKGFCSDECSSRHGGRIVKMVRRARVNGRESERINPFEVFIKAGWKCQQCGVETPRKLRGTHSDRAPELDHVIPIACGGTHTKDNVQLLCRKCNQDKGATIQTPATL